MATASMLPRPALRLLGDERLAALAAGGDDAAFGALYARHQAALLRYCRSIVRNDHDAFDALQSAMLKALVALRRNGRNAPLRPWLYRIAHNESVSLLRRARAGATGDEIEAVAGSGDVHERAASREALAETLADLDELTAHQRAALVLRELGGLGYGEVASALDTTPGAARQAVFSARTALHDRRDAREVTCGDVRAGTASGRPLRAHLRTCDDCRRVRRRHRIPFLVPVFQHLFPAAADTGAPVAAKLAVTAIVVGAAAVGTGPSEPPPAKKDGPEARASVAPAPAKKRNLAPRASTIAVAAAAAPAATPVARPRSSEPARPASPTREVEERRRAASDERDEPSERDAEGRRGAARDDWDGPSGRDERRHGPSGPSGRDGDGRSGADGSEGQSGPHGGDGRRGAKLDAAGGETPHSDGRAFAAGRRDGPHGGGRHGTPVESTPVESAPDAPSPEQPEAAPAS